MASFEKDLYFGLRNDAEVTKLQEFLRDQRVYTGPITGGFFSLTRDAVKKFQEKEKIIPAAGFFGRLTRARANSFLSANPPSETITSSLASQIAALQAKLAELQEKLKKEGSVPSASISPAAPVEPEPVKVKKLIIKGGSDISFPVGTEVSLKLGKITLANQTDNDIFLAQLQVKITDNMDSPFNRDKEVIFVLRRGETTGDPEISKTKFTFNSNAPLTSPHTASTNFSLPETLRTGEERTFGLWIDNLQYVARGSLDIELISILTTIAVESEGTLRFRLTK